MGQTVLHKMLSDGAHLNFQLCLRIIYKVRNFLSFILNGLDNRLKKYQGFTVEKSSFSFSISST